MFYIQAQNKISKNSEANGDLGTDPFILFLKVFENHRRPEIRILKELGMLRKSFLHSTLSYS